jgi:hypothetical protein
LQRLQSREVAHENRRKVQWENKRLNLKKEYEQLEQRIELLEWERDALPGKADPNKRIFDANTGLPLAGGGISGFTRNEGLGSTASKREAGCHTFNQFFAMGPVEAEPLPVPSVFLLGGTVVSSNLAVLRLLSLICPERGGLESLPKGRGFSPPSSSFSPLGPSQVFRPRSGLGPLLLSSLPLVFTVTAFVR